MGKGSAGAQGSILRALQSSTFVTLTSAGANFTFTSDNSKSSGKSERKPEGRRVCTLRTHSQIFPS